MENDFQTALKRFWTTIWHLRKGKQCTVNTAYSGDGVLLTSTKNVVNRWREYFENLLKPTDTPSGGETGSGDRLSYLIDIARLSIFIRELFFEGSIALSGCHRFFLFYFIVFNFFLFIFQLNELRKDCR